MRRSRCPIDYALDLLGDRWTLIVLRDLLMAGKTSFSELKASQEGIATNILADRLKKLEEHGVIDRQQDQANRHRGVYVPTAKALDLLPAMFELIRWSTRHDADCPMPADMINRFETESDAMIAGIRARFGKTD